MFYSKSRWGMLYNPFYLVRKELYRGIEQHASNFSGHLVDLGCGTKPYKHLFTNLESYIGLDIEHSGNQDGKSEVDVYYDGHRFPFEDEQIDVVFSSETFEHIFNLPEILSEINRVLKPGGQLLFTCPFFWPEHEVPFDYARYTSFALRNLLKEKGFEVLAEKKTGHYLLVLWQARALYLYFIINKIPWLSSLFFVLFITPCFMIGSLLNYVLPAKMKRQDLYMNHVILAKKI
ncbi:MAG: class I SAM-dependent methyltransferase [Chitinophagaceae bacterium]|nr:class I SAM-dependent methyltransferase [Chitinophagaceae bacterium]